MKKTIYLITLSILGFVACTSENNAAMSTQQIRPEAMKNFERSLKDLLKPENRATEEERKNATSMELSDRRKDLLIPAAKELIMSTGISEDQIRKETQNDRNEILKRAMKIYKENYRSLQQSSKL